MTCSPLGRSYSMNWIGLSTICRGAEVTSVVSRITGLILMTGSLADWPDTVVGAVWAKAESGRASAQSAAEAAYDRIAVLNSILSDYDSDSELSRLSRTSGQGKAVPVSTDLWRVLVRAQEFAAMSDGAFDITVGPLVNLWRRARHKQELPSPGLIAEMK